MLTVGQADDTINAVGIAHLGVSLDSVHDGGRIGEAGSFEEDGIEVLATGGELAEGADEVTADGAADAAVVHGDEIFGSIERFGHCVYVDIMFGWTDEGEFKMLIDK